ANVLDGEVGHLISIELKQIRAGRRGNSGVPGKHYEGGIMRKSMFLAQLLILLLLSWNLSAFAQQPVGSIEGTVTDPSGAVIQGATVTITEKTTGRIINTKTNAEGFFEARALLPGQYTVKIQQTGFNAEVLDNVTVLVGQVAKASVALKVGAAQEVVNVSAD